MRIRVKDVLEMLAGGATEQQILDDFLIWKKRLFERASNTRLPKLITQSFKLREDCSHAIGLCVSPALSAFTFTRC